jgi:hypothetical protein
MTEREIIEAKLRTLDCFVLDAALATFAGELLAALRESRKADVDVLHARIHDLNIRAQESVNCGDPGCLSCPRRRREHRDALAALSRLAGDE